MNDDPAYNDWIDCKVELERARETMTTLLKNVAIRKDRCRSEKCRAEMLIVRHANGRETPYDADGTNHFITCPDRDRFRKARHATTGTRTEPR